MNESINRNKLSRDVDADRERAQSEAIFLSIGDGAIATDADGKIRRINHVALDILGYSEKEVIGQWFPKILQARNDDGDPYEMLERPVSQAFLTGQPVSSKTQYLTKSGKLVPVAITVSPILLEGKPVGAIEVFRDITQEHEIDRMKSEFISIASHQLRTPLTAIKTYSHLLASGYKGNLSNDQHEFMDIILSSIDRMNDLINTLLDISRIEEGILSTTSQATPLDDLVEELITEVHSMAEAKNTKINFQLKGNNFILTTDPMLLKELVANLVTNAVKYTPVGGKVDVKVEEKSDVIVLTVKDNGYGIPRSQQQRVFTKFFRGDNVVTIDPTGTGLGLYLVRRIADNLGGKVWFKSDEGKGSTFYISLPKI
jgi:PAS domain S-box-containing protein